ncbi:MAG: hypothetical protein LUF35_07100 [Lachnospiraceae bacterium]|nr:hypothetical protein [Lachnospiraceae bacterium]
MSKQIKKINAISNYYDIKAGCYWAPQEALNEIFGLTMHLKASYEGEVLDTVFKRNNRFGVFDQWEIEDDKGNPLTIDEKNLLKEYFSESRYVFIEKEWDSQYETNWRTYIKDVENKVRQTNAGVNCQKNGNQTKSKLITTDLISEIIKLLIIFDIRGFLSDPFINQKVDEVFDSLDQCISGFSDMELEPDDRMHPMETTTKEAFRHQYILHNCYDILKGNKMSGTAEVMWKTYKQNLVPNFCLTDTAHPFVTSEHPAFVNELPDGKMEL